MRFEAKETAAAAAAAVQTRASRPLGIFLQNCASTKLALDVLRSCAELALKSISWALQRFAESSSVECLADTSDTYWILFPWQVGQATQICECLRVAWLGSKHRICIRCIHLGTSWAVNYLGNVPRHFRTWSTEVNPFDMSSGFGVLSIYNARNSKAQELWAELGLKCLKSDQCQVFLGRTGKTTRMEN